jgi:ATPase subunit of ABC transporter with duplicated ATPase domains
MIGPWSGRKRGTESLSSEAALLSITNATLCEPAFEDRPGGVLFTIRNLAIAKGSVVSVVGESGCGKTTFLRSLLDSRYAIIGGEVVATPTARLMLLSQDYRATFTPALSVLRQLRDVRRERGRTAAHSAARMGFSLGLSARHLRATPPTLSGGELQRAGLARVMLTPATVLLLDEPTASQDSNSRRLVASVIRRHVARHNGAVVIATHDRAFAKEVSDVVLRIADGLLEPEQKAGQVTGEDLPNAGGTYD